MHWCLPTTALGCLVVAVLVGCSVTGEAVGARVDLTDRSVKADDFPVSGATRVPQQAVAFALDGLTGSDPAVSDPADCTPRRLDSQGAVVFQGLAADSTSSYISGVAYAENTVKQVNEQAKRCPHATGGTAAASSSVTTVVDPAPTVRQGIAATSIRRAVVTGGAQSPLTTSSLTLIAQRGQVRVSVQYRWSGSSRIDPGAAAELDSLFTKAVAAAFA